MSDLNLHDGLVLLFATLLLITFFYVYNYYRKLRRQWRIREAEYARLKMLRPPGLPPFLIIGQSLLPALAILIYLGVVCIVIFDTVWAGLFWFVFAAVIIWFRWVQPHIREKQPESPGQSDETAPS
jgi:hypothetical protein